MQQPRFRLDSRAQRGFDWHVDVQQSLRMRLERFVTFAGYFRKTDIIQNADVAAPILISPAF
jgi:hypothetical protein